MPLGSKVSCSKCSKDESFMWHQGEKGVLCNECKPGDGEQNSCKVVEEEESKPPVQIEKPKPIKKTTRTTRSYKTRQNPNALPKQVSAKGKGRRHVFKKNPPTKLTAARATFTTTNSVYFKGTIWRSGDIVSVRDVNGGIYYAQLKLFLVDEYCEKSASITWLVPTRNDSPFPRPGFDPMTFIPGTDDDLPRKLDCFEFVMHCPPDYYKDNSPFPSGIPHPLESGYIWGRNKPR